MAALQLKFFSTGSIIMQKFRNESETPGNAAPKLAAAMYCQGGSCSKC